MSSETMSNARRFQSRFGGLWIDRSDWEKELDARARQGRVGAEVAALIPEFVRRGFVILPGAAEMVAIDAFRDDIARSFRSLPLARSRWRMLSLAQAISFTCPVAIGSTISISTARSTGVRSKTVTTGTKNGRAGSTPSRSVAACP
jgi:hypothetical protein